MSLDERIDSAIKQLRNRLQSPLLKWEVWQLVERFKIPREGFKFGKASFNHPEDDFSRNKLQAFSEHFRNVKKIKLSPSRLWPVKASRDVLCRIQVEGGDAKAAMRLAEAELITTLGVLNFFASVWSGNKGFPIVAVQGSACPYEVSRLAFTESPKPDFGAERRFYRHCSGALDPNWFTRSPSIQKAFQKADVFLKEEGERKLRARFLTAMKWAGKGAATQDPEDSFLFFALALETLILGEKKKEELRYRLALRIGHLLGSTKQEKSKLRDYVKGLYDLRSSLVHTGKAQIPDSDLDWLSTITLHSVLKLMSDESFRDVSTDDQLENWFEDALMNGPEK